MKKIITSALLIVGLSATAFAQTSGDLILGFRATGGTGSTSNLEVDLGSISNFVNFTGGTETVTNLLNSLPAGDSIDSVYGSSWNARSDVLWGIAGAITNGSTGPDSEPGRSLFGTVVAPTSTLDGTQTTTAYIEQKAATQGTAAANLTSLYGAMGSAVTVAVATTPTSWTGEVGTSSIAFGFFNKGSFDNNLSLGGAYAAGDLYSIIPNNVSGQPSNFLGTFAIHNNGDVTFSAVPEPSTYAAILGALVLGVVLIRRRQQFAA